MSTYAPRAHLRRPHVSLWLITVIGLAAAVVALGSWVLVDRYAGGKSAEQRAGAFIDELTATWTSGDAKAIAALYKSDAVLVNSSTDKRTVGRRRSAG